MAFGSWLKPMCSMLALLRNNVELEECGFIIDALQKPLMKALEVADPFVASQNEVAKKLVGLVLAYTCPICIITQSSH